MCLRRSKLLIYGNSMIEDKTLSLKVLVRVLFKISENTSMKLKNILVTLLSEIYNNFLASNTSSAEDENFFVAWRGVLIEPCAEIAESLNLGVVRPTKSSERNFIAVSGVDQCNSFSRAQDFMPGRWREKRISCL
jgi:hypothetical protein